MFDEAPKEAVRAIAYAGVSPAWAGPAGFLLRRTVPALDVPARLRRTVAVDATLFDRLSVPFK
jgi:hypothetical protein